MKITIDLVKYERLLEIEKMHARCLREIEVKEAHISKLYGEIRDLNALIMAKNFLTEIGKENMTDEELSLFIKKL